MASLWDRLLQGQAPTPRDIPANWDRRTTAQPAKTWLQDQGNYLANFGRQAMETLDPGIGLASQIGADAGRGNYASAAMGLPLLAMSVAPGPSPKPKGITAYHGSPHDFDKFDLSKIGTGEGAQAYGHGLYFAENEGVARSYRQDGKTPSMRFPEPNAAAKYLAERSGWSGPIRYDPDSSAVYAVEKSGGLLSKKTERLLGNVMGRPGDHGISFAGEIDNPGRMYEVRIKADPEQFLDWDKPLSQQSEAVRNALRGIYDDNATGELIARQSTADARDVAIMRGDNANTTFPASQARASEGLRDLGIPGIRYLDQGSRTAGEGSRNYVVFDDALVEILRKYGLIPGAYAGASLADMLTSADEPQY